LVLFITGMQNIRDVIPFPRTPKNAEFWLEFRGYPIPQIPN
jgi:aspartyl-tRNA synthetase